MATQRFAEAKGVGSFTYSYTSYAAQHSQIAT